MHALKAGTSHSCVIIKVRAGSIIFFQLYAASTSCFLYSHRRMPPETPSVTASRNNISETIKGCDTTASLREARIVTCQVLLKNLYTYKAVIVVISGPVFIFIDSARAALHH